MKKKVVAFILIIVAIIVVIFCLNGKKLYRYYKYDDVFEYGKNMTIYEVLKNDDINLGSYSYLNSLSFRKAKVKSIGSTVHEKIELNDHVIIFLGNRNLVEIDGKLYVYNE